MDHYRPKDDKGTVHNYISRIRVKLGVVGRLEAALYACRLGLTA